MGADILLENATQHRQKGTEKLAEHIAQAQHHQTCLHENPLPQTGEEMLGTSRCHTQARVLY